uniref:Uncharacterized protein n=1 Tax=Oryza brachyantha TaxID=4533 RepID=J3LGI3_ORYBR
MFMSVCVFELLSLCQGLVSRSNCLFEFRATQQLHAFLVTTSLATLTVSDAFPLSMPELIQKEIEEKLPPYSIG